MLDFIDFLKSRLNEDLPGLDAHKILTPKFKGKPFRNMTPSNSAKRSSVLILLEQTNSINIIFTLRSSTLNKHSGQISFPGGRVDFEESDEDAAIRETYEEIGLPAESIEIIGKLSTLYVPPSDNLITPFVGLMKSNPGYIPSPEEVEEIFAVSINELNLSHALKFHTDYFDGMEVEIPYFDVHPKTKLWGATSMILAELLKIYEEYLGKLEKV